MKVTLQKIEDETKNQLKDIEDGVQVHIFRD